MSPEASPDQGTRPRVRYDLGRIGAFLEHLGSPGDGTPTVHVAGSKGKGSTAALCASVLCQQGHRTGLYSSPHLHTFRERIAVDGLPISEADFASLVEKLWKPMEEINARSVYGQVTLFEMLTAMGLVHFRDRLTDFNVLEVGLGGRLDATNLVTPQVSVITSISLDHTSVLGDTLEKVATEKAGIIKPGVPVVSAPQLPQVMEVIRDACLHRGAILIEVGRDVRWDPGPCPAQQGSRAAKGQKLTITGRLGRYDLSIPLLGEYQLENAATALAALEVLREEGHEVSEEALRDGFARVQWPCRMELLMGQEGGPLVVADGAHNPYSAARLRDSLPRYFDYASLFLVVGVSRDKNLEGIVAELAQMEPGVIVTSSRHPRAASASALAQAFLSHGIRAQEVAGVEQALRLALEKAGDRDLVLATGSLFLAAEVRETVKGIEPELYPELVVG